MEKETYCVLLAVGPGLLQQSVRESISRGFLPLGGIAIADDGPYGNRVYAQAVCSPDAIMPPGAAQVLKRELEKVLPRKKSRKRKR